MEEENFLLIDDLKHEINYKTNGINQEILRINKKFTDDIYELNKKYDYWLNNKNFVLYSISTIIIFFEYCIMSFIDNNIIPILSGENLNMIVLDYKWI